MMVWAMFRTFSRALSCRYGQRLHVPADAGEQRQTQQVLRQLLADIALVAEQLAGQLPGQRRDRRGVMDRGQLQGDDLMTVVEDKVQLEAEEPAHLAALGKTGKCRLMR